jgi:hypothetical protein
LSNLTRRNLIKTADPFPKPAKDFDLHGIQAFDEVVDQALHRHMDAVNPLQQLQDPTQGRPPRQLVDLVRDRLALAR